MGHLIVVTARHHNRRHIPLLETSEKLKRSGQVTVAHFSLKLIQPLRNLFLYIRIRIIIGKDLVKSATLDHDLKIIFSGRIFMVDLCPYLRVFLFTVNQDPVQIKQETDLDIREWCIHIHT